MVFLFAYKTSQTAGIFHGFDKEIEVAYFLTDSVREEEHHLALFGTSMDFLHPLLLSDCFDIGERLRFCVCTSLYTLP